MKKLPEFPLFRGALALALLFAASGASAATRTYQSFPVMNLNQLKEIGFWSNPDVWEEGVAPVDGDDIVVRQGWGASRLMEQDSDILTSLSPFGEDPAMIRLDPVDAPSGGISVGSFTIRMNGQSIPDYTHPKYSLLDKGGIGGSFDLYNAGDYYRPLDFTLVKLSIDELHTAPQDPSRSRGNGSRVIMPAFLFKGLDLTINHYFSDPNDVGSLGFVLSKVHVKNDLILGATDDLGGRLDVYMSNYYQEGKVSVGVSGVDTTSRMYIGGLSLFSADSLEINDGSLGTDPNIDLVMPSSVVVGLGYAVMGQITPVGDQVGRPTDRTQAIIRGAAGVTVNKGYLTVMANDFDSCLMYAVTQPTTWNKAVLSVLQGGIDLTSSDAILAISARKVSNLSGPVTKIYQAIVESYLGVDGHDAGTISFEQAFIDSDRFPFLPSDGLVDSYSQAIIRALAGDDAAPEGHFLRNFGGSGKIVVNAGQRAVIDTNGFAISGDDSVKFQGAPDANDVTELWIANMKDGGAAGQFTFNAVQDQFTARVRGVGNVVVTVADGLNDVFATASELVLEQGATFKIADTTQTLAGLTFNGGTLDIASSANLGGVGATVTDTFSVQGTNNFLRIKTDFATGTANQFDFSAVSVADTHFDPGAQVKIYVDYNPNQDPASGNPIPVVIGNANADVAFANANSIVLSGNVYTYDVQKGSAIDAPVADNWYLHQNRNGPPSPVVASGAAGAIAVDATWYAQLDNIHRRMGELRIERGRINSGKGDFWVRSYGSQSDFSADIVGHSFTEHKYGVDFGTDFSLSAPEDANVIYAGFFGGYGEARRDFDSGVDLFGNGQTRSYGAGLYALWMAQNGWYATSVAKLNLFDHSFSGGNSVTATSGKYENVGFGVSVEFGRYLNVGATGWFVDPSAQFAFTMIEGATYTALDGLRFDLQSKNLFRFRSGTRIGHIFRLGGESAVSVYGSGYVYAQSSFRGKLDVTGDDGQIRYDANIDGVYGEFGVGVDYAFNSIHQIHVQYNATVGKRYKEPWAIDVGYRMRF